MINAATCRHVRLVALTSVGIALVTAGCASQRVDTSSGGTTESTSASQDQPCSAGRLVITVSAQGATQGMTGAVSLKEQGADPCVPPASLRFAVARPGEAYEMAIVGNPAVVALPADMANETTFERSWTWRNWCGEGQDFKFTASAGPVSAQEAIRAPVCVDQEVDSNLTPGQG